MVGACLAEYHRGKISKEDFNRGNSPANKGANWEFVQKFLRKRGFSLYRDDVECLCTVSGGLDSNVLFVWRNDRCYHTDKELNSLHPTKESHERQN